MANTGDQWGWPVWPDVTWGEIEKPVVIAEGQARSLSSHSAPISVSSAYIIGVNDKTFPQVCERMRTNSLHFYEMRVGNLDGLRQFENLRHLSIRWNTKITDITPLGMLRQLQTLVLEDVPKITELAPLATLDELRGLVYSGGIWNKNRAKTLAPLAKLRRLEDLQLLNLTVAEGGLRPLADCASLRKLEVSNQFETADYAFLSVHCPDLVCDMLAPYVRLGHPIEDKDVMVVGKRKPFLDSRKDGERLAKYERAFDKLQSQFRVERNGTAGELP